MDNDKMTELQNEALNAATEHIREQRKKSENMRLKIKCLTAVICVLIVTLGVVVCFAINAQQETIREQQYAMNMQYAQLMEYIANAEVTSTETIDILAQSSRRPRRSCP